MDPDVIGRIAEHKIQEAMEEGKFDNLPGKGKPIVFDEDSSTPLHLRMANKVLKNAGVLPDWMQAQKDVIAERQEVSRLLSRLTKENQQRRVRLEALPAYHIEVSKFASWHVKSRADYLRRLKSVNTAILKFSMLAPTTAQSFFPYRIEAEMATFDAAFPPLEMQSAALESNGLPSDAQSKSREKSTLKAIARERYQVDGGGPVRGWSRAARLVGLGKGDPVDHAGSFESEDIKRADVPDAIKRGLQESGEG